MMDAKAFSVSFEQAAREDFLEKIARQRLCFLNRSSVADFATACRDDITACLEPLMTSHFVEASELQALASASKGFCRVLGQATSLTAVLGLVVHGFEEMHGLMDGCARRIAELEQESEAVRELLRSLSKERVRSARADAGHGLQGWPDQCRTVLEIVSVLLQPGEPSHDSVAVRKLLLDGAAGERAAAWQMQSATVQQCRRFQKLMVQHRDTVAFVQDRGGAAGAFAAWLVLLYVTLEDQQRIREMHRAKRAIAEFVNPMARWAIRPLCGPSLGRVEFAAPKSRDFRAQALAALVTAAPTPAPARTRPVALHAQQPVALEQPGRPQAPTSADFEDAARTSGASRVWAPAPASNLVSLQDCRVGIGGEGGMSHASPHVQAPPPVCNWQQEYGSPPGFEQVHHQLQIHRGVAKQQKDVRSRMHAVLEAAADDGSLEQMLGCRTQQRLGSNRTQQQQEITQPKCIVSAPPAVEKKEDKGILAARRGSSSSCSTAVTEEDMRDFRGFALAGSAGSSGAGDNTPALLEFSSDEEESLGMSLGLSR